MDQPHHVFGLGGNVDMCQRASQRKCGQTLVTECGKYEERLEQLCGPLVMRSMCGDCDENVALMYKESAAGSRQDLLGRVDEEKGLDLLGPPRCVCSTFNGRNLMHIASRQRGGGEAHRRRPTFASMISALAPVTFPVNCGLRYSLSGMLISFT